MYPLGLRPIGALSGAGYFVRRRSRVILWAMLAESDDSSSAAADFIALLEEHKKKVYSISRIDLGMRSHAPASI